MNQEDRRDRFLVKLLLRRRVKQLKPREQLCLLKLLSPAALS
jgi:hypothetical protein